MESILREPVIPPWIPILLVGCLALAAMAKLIDHKRFDEFIWLPFTNKYFKVSGKDRNIFTPFNMFLFGLQTLSFSIFLFYAVQLQQPQPNFYDGFLFVRILGFLVLFIVIKFYVEKITAHLFSIENTVDTYLYYKLSHKNWLGLFLVPFNFLVFYTFRNQLSFFVIVVMITLLINLFLLFYVYREHQKTIVNNIFYFILYLCTLEIFSYYLLYQLLVN